MTSFKAWEEEAAKCLYLLQCPFPTMMKCKWKQLFTELESVQISMSARSKFYIMHVHLKKDASSCCIKVVSAVV